jgi:hypothetical protein
MIRIYDTSKGIIPTDEENRCLRKPGHILIFWTEHNGTYRGARTKEKIPLNNIVEEILEGEKIKYDLRRLMDKCPILKRMTTITEEEYQRIWNKYEKPGCFGQIIQEIGLSKNIDDELRDCFEK